MALQTADLLVVKESNEVTFLLPSGDPR